MDWELIRQQKRIQINIDNIWENNKIADCDYKVEDKLMLNNKDTCKYETPYIGSF